MESTINPIWEQMPLTPIRAAGTARPAQAANIESISPIRAGNPAVKTGAGEAVNPFTDIFRASIDAVKETDMEKTQMEYLMATGQLDNPALLTIASTKASLAVSLLVELRNQAMDAYNKLTQINM